MTSIRRSLVFSFTERYGNLVVNVLSIAILARLLSPAETGLYSVAAALVNIAQALREFGVGTYILQEKELTRENLASATGVCLTIALALSLVFSLGAGAIAQFYGNPQLSPIIQILSINFIVVAFASIGTAQLQREMKFHHRMSIALTANIFAAVVSTGLAALDFGAISLAWGSLVGVLVTVAGNYLALGARGFAVPTLRNWRRLLNFGVFSSGSGLLFVLAERTPDLVVARLINLEGAGLFSRGNGLITLFRAALTNAIDPVIGGSLAKIHREGGDASESLLRIFSYITGLGWPALSVLALLANPIITLAFGPKWLPAVAVAQILCAATAFALITNICQTYLTATGRVRAVFHIQVISVPGFLGGVGIGALHSLAGAAVGAAAIGGLLMLVSITVLRLHISIGWVAIGRAVFPSLLAAVLTSLPPLAVVLTVGVSGGKMGGASIVAVIGAAIAWLGAVFLVRHPLRHELAVVGVSIGRKMGC